MRRIACIAAAAAASCAAAQPAAAESIPFIGGVYASAKTCAARAAGASDAGEAPTLYADRIEAIEFNCRFLSVHTVPDRPHTALAVSYCEAPGEGYGALITVRRVTDEGAYEVTLGEGLFAADEDGSLPWFVPCTGGSGMKDAQ